MFLKHEYVRPLGSLLIGIPAAVKEPAVASLTAWCLVVLVTAGTGCWLCPSLAVVWDSLTTHSAWQLLYISVVVSVSLTLVAVDRWWTPTAFMAWCVMLYERWRRYADVSHLTAVYSTIPRSSPSPATYWRRGADHDQSRLYRAKTPALRSSIGKDSLRCRRGSAA